MKAKGIEGETKIKSYDMSRSAFYGTTTETTVVNPDGTTKVIKSSRPAEQGITIKIKTK